MLCGSDWWHFYHILEQIIKQWASCDELYAQTQWMKSRITTAYDCIHMCDVCISVLLHMIVLYTHVWCVSVKWSIYFKTNHCTFKMWFWFAGGLKIKFQWYKCIQNPKLKWLRVVIQFTDCIEGSWLYTKFTMTADMPAGTSACTSTLN